MSAPIGPIPAQPPIPIPTLEIDRDLPCFHTDEIKAIREFRLRATFQSGLTVPIGQRMNPTTIYDQIPFMNTKLGLCESLSIRRRS